MTTRECFAVLAVYASSLTLVIALFRRGIATWGLNFHALFTLVYLLVFYAGFPLSCLLQFCFDTPVPPPRYQIYALLVATAFYVLYALVYRWRSLKQDRRRVTLVLTAEEARLTGLLLALLSLIGLGVFLFFNGLLLFKLDSYSQIFSRRYVSLYALKRFFYFFLPGMAILYFLKRDRKAWLFFLAATVVFGLMTYVAIGGTRANLLLALVMFLFIGLIDQYLRPRTLLVASFFGVALMFALAIGRYHNLAFSGTEGLRAFLYMTRDTFSPWENVALILERHDSIEVQGFMPILRDFYVFIPKWLWPGRPDQIINTAVYFTQEVLHRKGALVISPTLVGSLLIMGGALAIPLGALVVGLLIAWPDRLYAAAREATERGTAALLLSYCLGTVFNVIILVREGVDSFVSRMVFFSAIFALCLLLAKGFCRVLNRWGGATRRSHDIP